MKSLFLALLVAVALGRPAAAQRYSTRMATIDFFSDAPLEDIKAKNTQVAATVDLLSQQLAFVANLKEFDFPDKLMQAHFNENFVESEKYPRATFSGRISGLPEGGLPAVGTTAVQVEGELTLHGVKRRIKLPASLEMQDKQLVAKAQFNVAPADYKIDIPSLVKEHIAKSVAVTVYAVCAPQGPTPQISSQTTRP
ncbi:YceI family protein [Hymenobacter busanensis]|uniref:YceI family protein n=1 Tax=Hymenobacter busanensis TaxID=2607656 RepID=A0A7L5A1Z9_9BACT|nr:YceI family protein [Hymenobacter busanensis]KAA9338537.1 YceI family protein [Hymenobacter busanensis]QHJ09035.1 YceI family protein [Hymenobacter busanensis]